MRYFELLSFKDVKNLTLDGSVLCVGKTGNKHEKKTDDRMQEKSDRNGGGQKNADQRELIRIERQAIDI